MTQKELETANEHQLLTFASGYDLNWRLTKLHLLTDLLRRRSEIPTLIQSPLEGIVKLDEQYLYGPMTNGILFDAVSELIMYSEDLFAFLRAAHSKTHFVQKLITYKAGQVTNLADHLLRLNQDEVAKLFFLPRRSWLAANAGSSSPSPDEVKQFTEAYDEAISRFVSDLQSVVSTFKVLGEFYLQYKHGLTVALRVLGNPLDDEEINRRKQSDDGFLCVYENDNLAGTVKRKRAVIPNLAPEIQPYLNELLADRNLLKHFFPLDSLGLSRIIEDAGKVYRLLYCSVRNRIERLQPFRENLFTSFVPSPTKGRVGAIVVKRGRLPPLETLSL